MKNRADPIAAGKRAGAAKQPPGELPKTGSAPGESARMLATLIGNLDGAALSLILFSLTVVSFPLLLDREVDFVTAMVTSVRAVVMSPVPMIGWAAIVVILLIVSSIPYFLGLIVTLPVLGHTTWHLYRRVVAPEALP